MKILLDTHIVLWALSEPERLSSAVVEMVMSMEHDVWVSHVSAWEMMIKSSLGKLIIPHDLESSVYQSGFRWLPIQYHHIDRLKTLPLLHHDPFDRLLICQALEEGMTLVTADGMIHQYDVSLLRMM